LGVSQGKGGSEVALVSSRGNMYLNAGQRFWCVASGDLRSPTFYFATSRDIKNIGEEIHAG